MLSCVTTKLVSCPDDEVGEAVVESETEGGCRENLDAAMPVSPACESEEPPAMGEVTRGLLPEVTVRGRGPESEDADA